MSCWCAQLSGSTSLQQLMWDYKCPHLKISVTHRPKLSQQSKNYWCRNHKPQWWHVRCCWKQLPSNQPSPLQSFPFPLNCDSLLFLFSSTPPSHLSFHRLKKNEEKRHRGCFLCFSSSQSEQVSSYSQCGVKAMGLSPIGATERLLKVVFDSLLNKIITIK